MAEIAVGLAIKAGEQLVRKLVDTMHNKVSNEVSLLLGVHQQVEYIIDELEMMSAFLREAEEKQMINGAARAWVKQVKKLSYSVEDCVAEFSLHLEKRGTKNLTVPRRIATEIQSIKAKVEEVSKRRLRYGITDLSKRSSGDGDSVARYDPRLASGFIEDSQLVGLDGPKDKLVGWLLDETECGLSLIAVVGGGGLGKTTLARKVYQDPNVGDGRFKCRAWIAVSQVYHTEGLLRDMFKQLSHPPPADLDKMNMLPLTDKLRDYLKDKRYVIVFDDVWKFDAWKSFEFALPKNDLGSKVILTTRNKEVAEACRTPNPQLIVHIHYLAKLSPEQSMELFCTRVFGNPEHTCPEDLKKLSQDILDKCDGLPLAIVSIAGVLASKPEKSIQEWEGMLRRLGSELEGRLEVLKQILTFSYNDLPYHVKHCFLYLSKFPEDYLIERKRVQSLWIAEGLVAGRRDMTEEEVAESYFNELVNRFMILPSVFSADNNKVKKFSVHDIMLELIVSKSMEENFMSVLGKNSKWTSRDMIRRISLHGGDIPSKMSISHARSLSVFGDGKPMVISPSLEMLQVLDLDGYKALNDNHLKNVVKLRHLKYLSLKYAPGVYKLPESLGDLYCLETLDVRETEISSLPASLVKLQQLRSLRGGSNILDSYISVPKGIRNLTALEMLEFVKLKDSKKVVIKEIGMLTQMKKLSVSYLEEESGGVFWESLNAIGNSLRSIKIHCRDTTLTFLQGLPSPPSLLKSIKLIGRLGKLPLWVGSLDNVHKISLGWSKLDNAEDIQVFGTLPNLMKLVLHDEAYKGESLSFGAEGFLHLKMLIIDGLSDLKALSFEGGAMCSLESIRVKVFGNPMTISGIGNLLKLKQISMTGPRRVDLRDIDAQVTCHPNHPQLIARYIVGQ